MQAHAKVWLVAAALTTLPGCAEQDPSDAARKPVPRTSPADDPYDYSPSGSGGGAGKGGASTPQGGSAGRAGGSGSAGASVAGSGSTATGGDGAAAGTGSGKSGGGAGAGGVASNGDCPSLTLARRSDGTCVDRVKEFDVAQAPTSIVLGADGKIWVDDDQGNQLLQLDDEGNVIGRVSCDPGSSPRALVGGTGDAILWYSDAGKKALVKVTRDQQKVPFELGFPMSALALGAHDDLFVTELGKAVYRVQPGQTTWRWPASPTDAIVVTPENDVWFSQGAGVAQLNPAADVKSFPLGDNAYASGLCVGPDAGLWFSDGFASQLVRVTWDGLVTRTINLRSGTAPGRLITGPDGAFWFVESGVSKIGRVTLRGEITDYPLPTPDSLPHALTVGADGNIWFTQLLSHKVGRLIPDPVP